MLRGWVAWGGDSLAGVCPWETGRESRLEMDV